MICYTVICDTVFLLIKGRKQGLTVCTPCLDQGRLPLEAPTEDSKQQEADDAHIAIEENGRVAHLHGGSKAQLATSRTQMHRWQSGRLEP